MILYKELPYVLINTSIPLRKSKLPEQHNYVNKSRLRWRVQ